MSVLNQGAAFTKSVLGIPVSKATGTLTDVDGVALFVVSGLVAVTSMVGKVTTAITVANSYSVLWDPDLGTAYTIAAAADLGTTDTATGEILICDLDGTALAVGAREQTKHHLVLDDGQIEHNSNGTDGAITWYLTYVPIEDGASVVAA